MGGARRALIVGGMAAVGLAALGVGLWAAPAALERLLADGPRAARSPAADQDPAVTAFLDRELAAMGAALGSASAGETAASRPVHRLPLGTPVADAAAHLRAAARAADIELHTAPLGDLDVEVRVYAGKRLDRTFLLREAAQPMAPAPDAPTLRERPLVAIVVRGLGDKPPGDLTTLPVPLTLAIPPFQPWSLRLAEEGMRHWHEVLVELEAGPEAAAPGEQALAVPYASGALVVAADTPLPSPERLPHGVVVHTGQAPAAPGYAPVRALAPAGAPATEALARAWSEATRDGVATVVLSAQDPTFPQAIQAVLQADDLGYRLVLASEAARWQDVRGIPSSETRDLNR